MCCFSNAPAFDKVSGTQIFARFVAPGRQALAYSMTLSARAPLAMVLPLPVAAGTGEDALQFVDLSGCPKLFDHLNLAFPLPQPRGGPVLRSARPQLIPLKVHQVGDFEASFVPTVADFSRLDPRFRIAPEVWAGLPDVADYGFAVFQLRGFDAEGGLLSFFKRKTTTRTFHPMAFVFPSRQPDSLFFPTVHIHDGDVHDHADFDHTLYAQGLHEPQGWARSSGLLSRYVPLHETKELVVGGFAHRMKLKGRLPNRDMWVAVD